MKSAKENIIALRNFISENENENEDYGRWEYGYSPMIESTLKKFNKEEAECFSKEIWEWPNFHLYQLADPIIFCENKYLKSNFLYSKIFGSIEDLENLEYLAENLRACMPESEIENWDFNVLQNVKKNLLRVIDYIGESGWRKSHNELVEILKSKIKGNNNAN